jgi:1-acyl-sn-glycerol-3-phosphate acyltransferase
MSDWKLRPARDIGLAPAERLRSLARERGLVGLALNAAWRRTVRAGLAAFHRLEIAGRENLPPPPFVLIANHTSHLDALVLAAALRGEAARNAHALAAGEVFFGAGATAAFAAYAVNAFPIWRGRTRRGDLQLLRQRLVEDRLVYILFPEGTRSRSGAMAPFQPGLAALVAGTGVPVVPCCIQGAHAAWPPDRRWPRPGRLRLTIGPAISTGNDDRDSVTARAESAVRALAASISHDSRGAKL